MQSKFGEIPEETILNICELLLESTSAHRRLFKDKTSMPHTLFALRGTCRKLCRIATPYAFHHLSFSLRPKSMTTQECEINGYLHTRPFSDLEFLSWNSNLAAHISILQLKFTGRGEDFREAQVTLARLIPSLVGLRAFSLNDVEALTPLATRFLLSIPSLRILDIGKAENSELGGFYGINLDGIDLSHIKALNVSRAHSSRPIFERFDGLESFSIEGMKEADKMRLVKLQNIKELTIDDAESNGMWDTIKNHVINSSIQKSCLSSLQELSIMSCHEYERVQCPNVSSIVDTFRSAPLRKLIIHNRLASLDVNNLALVVEAYPLIEELAIFRNPLYNSIPSQYQKMLEILGRAKNLRILEWNLVPMEFVNPSSFLPVVNRSAYRYPRASSMQMRAKFIPQIKEAMAPHVKRLASACKTLHTVRYTASMGKHFYSFFILRDNAGDCIRIDSCNLDLGASSSGGSNNEEFQVESMRSTTIWDAWLSPYI